jgi:hypothetical protein
MKIEIAYDQMDAATEAMLRSKEDLIRRTPRTDTDWLRWRVEQRGVQKRVVLSKYSDRSAIVFDHHPHDYFHTLKDEHRKRIEGPAALV